MGMCGIYVALEGIFVTGTYLAIICKVAVAVSYILIDIGKYVGSVCLFSIMAL